VGAVSSNFQTTWVALDCITKFLTFAEIAPIVSANALVKQVIIKKNHH